uniref:Uncharacterized protein n=1 Tax=Anguilla anguilla TaxID=7936 RepID=A0A0E9WV51_ANGAN
MSWAKFTKMTILFGFQVRNCNFVICEFQTLLLMAILSSCRTNK